MFLMTISRGRPKKKADSEEEEDMPTKKKSAYVPTGKPRGCPPGGWPEKPKKPSTYVPTGKPRGRPPKSKTGKAGSDNDE